MLFWNQNNSPCACLPPLFGFAQPALLADEGSDSAIAGAPDLRSILSLHVKEFPTQQGLSGRPCFHLCSKGNN